MNDARRKLLSEAYDLIERAQAIITDAGDDEQSYFDEMAPSFQDGERGQRAAEVASSLQDLADELDSALTTLDGAVK